MSTDQSGRIAPGNGSAARMRSRRIWVPALWTLYGAAYAAVFAVRGQAAEAAITGTFVLVIAVGLAVELRLPQAAGQRVLGWEHDERQRLVHLHAAALTGYLAAAAALVAGFAEFALGSVSVTWPMNILGGLILVYGAGLAFYSRRV